MEKKVRVLQVPQQSLLANFEEDVEAAICLTELIGDSVTNFVLAHTEGAA